MDHPGNDVATNRGDSVERQPRGTRPDAVVGATWYLIKNVSRLRLTYQIRLATYLAIDRRSRVVIRVPSAAELSADLDAFARAHAAHLSVERV